MGPATAPGHCRDMDSKMSMQRLGYDNYETWKLRARQVLTREGLWRMVDDDLPELKNRTVEWYNKNELALQTIGYLVEDAQLRIIQDATTAKEAWMMLKNYFVKDSSAGKVALIKKLSKMELSEGGDMRQHLMDFEMLLERIENVGCHIDEDMKAAFILASLPDSYGNLVSSIQGRMEVFTMSFVRIKLLEEYERRREKGEDGQKAMMVKNVRKNEESNNYQRLCFACGSPNHIMRFCEVWKRARGESRLIDDKWKTQSANATQDSGGHICFAAIQEESSGGWFLDSGASRHMTGKTEQLDNWMKVDEQNVTLADGKSLRSTAVGAKVVEAVDGRGNPIKVSLENVLVVPGLAANLVSVQAIVERGFNVVFYEKVCHIMRNGKVIIAGTKQGKMYRLDFLS